MSFVDWYVGIYLVIITFPNTTTKEKCLLYLSHLVKDHHKTTIANESNKKWTKSQYDRFVCPHVFLEGGLVLVYDQDHNKLGAGKFEPLWYGPYIIKCVLKKGAYELVKLEGIPLLEPHNWLYLKKYYA